MLVSKLTSLLNYSLTIDQAKQLQALILINGLHHLESAFVRQFLGSPGDYSENTARYFRSILHHLRNPNAFTGACAIRFFCQHGQFTEAISQYVQMQRSGPFPSSFAVSSALKACARLADKMVGVAIHAQIHRYGLCGDVYVQTSLMGFYAKLGSMETARKVFDAMSEKNVVSWNSMLDGYLKSANLSMAERLFSDMPNKDVVSWNSMVSGYARTGDMEKAHSLFLVMPERNPASWNSMIAGYVDCDKIELARSFYDSMPQRNYVSSITMIGGYSKCGDVESARELFDEMGQKNHLLYNSMIACYAQNSRSKEAIQLFKEMLQPAVNIQPDRMTLASVISACSQLGDMEFGSWIKSYMNKVGITMDDHLATAFIDLYAKCGSIDEAYTLFLGLQRKDVVSYTAMIMGCGINGRAKEATQLFDEMIRVNIRPNLVTFTGLLTALNHVGMVEESYHYFNSMRRFGLEPSVDHYGVMVDTLGRAGRLDEGYELIQSMPMQPHAGVWGALLLACDMHKNVELGEAAAERCFDLEPDNTGYGSLLANIYASAGRWDDAKRMRKEIREKGFIKIPGTSWTHNA